MHNPGTKSLLAPGQSVVEQSVHQCPPGVSGGGMHHQSGRLIHYQQPDVFVHDGHRDILGREVIAGIVRGVGDLHPHHLPLSNPIAARSSDTVHQNQALRHKHLGSAPTPHLGDRPHHHIQPRSGHVGRDRPFNDYSPRHGSRLSDARPILMAAPRPESPPSPLSPPSPQPPPQQLLRRRSSLPP